MLCLSGFELYSRWVPLIKYMLQFRDRKQGFKILHKIFWPCRNFTLRPYWLFKFFKISTVTRQTEGSLRHYVFDNVDCAETINIFLLRN